MQLKLTITGFIIIGQLFFLRVELEAQSVAERPYIYMHAGTAIATGHLGKKTIGDNQSGFGGVGYYLTSGIEYSPKNKFGFFAELNARLIPIARKSMAAQLNQTAIYQGIYALSTPFPAGTTLLTPKLYPNWKVKNSDWRSAALLLGVNRKISLSDKEKIILVIKAGMGLLYARSPEMYAESITDSATALLEQNNNHALGYTARFGLAIEHHLRPKFKIIFSDDFDISGPLTFKNITAITTTTQGNYGNPNFIISKSSINGNLIQSFNSIQLSLGIAYLL